ncbi:hypothetical protein DERF_012886 [Dermatophagoides farinae]|uniref:Uncharacterized protein n=1 Tax=Dermatophagoides farinae TaxID=6954 RepID=A0A922HQY3_DERFA|nr:hypothetical protein DERF_012886 [Dermatophagoides farinae]
MNIYFSLYTQTIIFEFIHPHPHNNSVLPNHSVKQTSKHDSEFVFEYKSYLKMIVIQPNLWPLLLTVDV